MKNLSDIAAYDAIAYAGAEVYPWYMAWEVHEQALVLHVEICLEGVTGAATLTVADLRKALQGLLDAGHPGVQRTDWSDPQIDSEIDADLADQIVQYALLGDVVFG